jgi:ABC-type Fe3+/spermidine/putrescine transport system ATPase subunit
VARGRLRLQVAAADLQPGTPIVISIRPHLIEIVTGKPGPVAGADTNVLTGTVQRSSYLGDAVDYQVEIDEGGIVLRVAGPTPPRVRAGERVSLRVAPASCVPLAEGGDV